MLDKQESRIPRLFPGIHYAWIIIAIAAFMHMAGGSVRQAFGVLVVPLQQDMGWSPMSITFSYALGSIVGAAMAPLSGIATDRFGSRKVIMAGIPLFFLGAIVTGGATEVWHLWISYGVLLGVAQACFSVPILTAASYWFRSRLGLGMGLLQAAHGLGSGGDGGIPHRNDRGIDLEDGVLAHRAVLQRGHGRADAFFPQ